MEYNKMIMVEIPPLLKYLILFIILYIVYDHSSTVIHNMIDWGIDLVDYFK